MNANEPIEKGVKEAEPQEEQHRGPYVGGEVRIVVDSRTGAMSVTAPQNMLIALGILECAKAMLIKKQQDEIAAAQRSALARPSLDETRKLLRPS